MKINKVNYQKSFNIGPFLQEKIGFEADVEPGDSTVDILNNLKSKADEWHRNSNPHLYQSTTNVASQWDVNYIPPTSTATTATNGGPTVINIQDERLETEIDNCFTQDELK